MPKSRRARYYLGRVVKGGVLDAEKFIKALHKPASVLKSNYSWTITKCRVFGPTAKPKYVYARLAKYEPEGKIAKVDTAMHDEIDAEVDNKLIASSPFVYIPQYSGIAYQHIWNSIQQEVFVRRFSEIIIETFQKFFVKCEIDPITDYRTFIKRLIELEHINKLSATVSPPNPLFGILWKELKEYLKSRDIDELSIAEEGKKEKHLRTNLIELINLFIDKKGEEAVNKLAEKVAIGDAAVIMAADGYGRAKLEGIKGNHIIIIRTSENMKSFLFEKDPDPEELYEQAKALFEEINKERYMEH